MSKKYTKNTQNEVLFLSKLGRDLQFYIDAFCEFCERFQSGYFTDHVRTTASFNLIGWFTQKDNPCIWRFKILKFVFPIGQ